MCANTGSPQSKNKGIAALSAVTQVPSPWEELPAATWHLSPLGHHGVPIPPCEGSWQCFVANCLTEHAEWVGRVQLAVRCSLISQGLSVCGFAPIPISPSGVSFPSKTLPAVRSQRIFLRTSPECKPNEWGEHRGKPLGLLFAFCFLPRQGRTPLPTPTHASQCLIYYREPKNPMVTYFREDCKNWRLQCLCVWQ